ncbi:MAG: hypothetical protein AAF212_03895 [Verrucomicrobiota bacterium]
MPHLMPKLLLLLWVFTIPSFSLNARIGDSERSLDRRLTADRYAVELRGNGAQRLLESGPLRQVFDFSEDVEEIFEYKSYIKSANGDRLSTTDAKGEGVANGWNYTAVIFGGIVVAESYERVNGSRNTPINPHEMKSLLVINQLNHSWDELDEMTLPSGDKVDGLIEYDYLRSDGKVFAKSNESHIIFVRGELDERLRERRALKYAEIDAENLDALGLSVAGF